MSGSGGGATVLREFLVSIGYAETGRKQFSDNMIVVANQAVELGKTMARVAQDVVDAVGRISEGLENLYFASQRTRATVESINAIGFAASQTGSSVAAARGSLESFGRFLRTNPGGENFLSGLGVATRDANGGLRETGDLLRQTIKVLNTRQPGVAMAYANVLGIDEKTLLGLTAEADKFDETSRRMYKAAGVDQQRAARDAHLLEVEYRTLGEAVEVLSAKFVELFAPRFAADVRRWRELIEHNFGPITKVMEWVVDKIQGVIDIFSEMLAGTVGVVHSVADAWQQLDPESKRLIGIFAAVALAWRLLNAAFMLSPWGVVIALGAAIVGLYNDYKVWEEHGRSLIDWGKWKGEIDAAVIGMDSLKAPFKELAGEVDKLGVALAKLFGLQAGGGFHDWLTAEIKRTFADLRGIIDGATALIEILAAVAEGDMPRAWKLISKMNTAPDAGVTPREGAINSPFNSRGQMPGVHDLMDQRRREEGGDLWSRRPRWMGGTGGWFGAGRAGVGSAQVDQRAGAQDAYSYWRGRGLDNNGALAMVAQEQQESGFNPANHAGDGGNAHGLYQWQAPRRAAIRSATGIDIDSATANQQRDAAFAEMQGLDAGAVQAWAVLNNPNASLEEKVRAATKRFERPADKLGTEVPNRLAIARDWERQFQASPGPRSVAPQSTAEMERLRGLPPGTLPALVPPTSDVARGPFDWMRGGGRVPPATAPVPTDDTTVKVDPEYLRNRNAPVTYPPPLLDSPPLGAPANTNINTSTVAPVINQTTNIHLTGGADQNRQVIEGQQSVNERLVRNVSSATR